MHPRFLQFKEYEGDAVAGFIGTHSRHIEARLKQKFARLGWRNAFSFPCHSETPTAFGPVQFEDGVETWVNPREEPMPKLLNPKER